MGYPVTKADIERAVSEDNRRLSITYECTCGHEWTEIWSCACDSECPECGTRHIQARDYEELPIGSDTGTRPVDMDVLRRALDDILSDCPPEYFILSEESLPCGGRRATISVDGLAFDLDEQFIPRDPGELKLETDISELMTGRIEGVDNSPVAYAVKAALKATYANENEILYLSLAGDILYGETTDNGTESSASFAVYLTRDEHAAENYKAEADRIYNQNILESALAAVDHAINCLSNSQLAAADREQLFKKLPNLARCLTV